MIRFKKLVAAAGFVGLLGSCIGAAQAALVLDEGFEGNIPPIGWTIDNSLSTAGGSTTWFKGDVNVFTAQSGSPDSYAAANFLAAGNGGDIDDWLITPTIRLANGGGLSFFTRTDDPSFLDNLQVRLCKNAACNTASLAAFSTILIPQFAVPGAWTQESVTFSGMNAGDTGRIAFRYVCTNTAVNCDYIGIDTVQAVPEPSALIVFAVGLMSLGVHLRRRAAR